MTQLLNEREAATLLRLSVKCLQGWRVRGGGPPFLKLGRSVRYEVSALEAFVQEAVRRSTSDLGPARPGRPGIRVDHVLEKTGRRLDRLDAAPSLPAAKPR
jgi:Helix-turn-helix domain